MAEIRMITFSPNLLLSSEAPCSLNLWINSTFNWILWNWIKSHFGIMISVFPNESSFKGSHLYSVLKKSSLRILEVYKDSASKFSHPSYFLSFHLIDQISFFFLFNFIGVGNSLAVQWLRLCTFTPCQNPRFNPWSGARIPQVGQHDQKRKSVSKCEHLKKFIGV